MIHKITFLLHHKKNASSHLFSKQLKNLQSNLLTGGFISIIYSSFASGSSTGGAKAPGSSTPCFAPHALKGQKLLAQGIALGIIAISKAPCKGKSFVYCQVFESFCPYRATDLCP